MTSKLSPISHFLCENIVYKLLSSIFITWLLIDMEIPSLLYLFTALANSYIIVWFLFSYNNEYYSANKLVNIFLLFFFVIANALQFAENSIVSSIRITLDASDYEKFQLLVFLILILYNGLYLHTRYKKQVFAEKNYSPLIVKNPPIKQPILVAISLFALMSVFLYYDFNVFKIMFRGLAESFAPEMSESTADEDEGIIGGLIFSKFLRAMPCMCYIIATICNWSKKTRFILFISMLVATFPLGLARNAAAMYWLPFVLITLKLLHKPNRFVPAMLIGLLIIFPFLDNFRYFDGTVKFEFSIDYFNTMNFDASQEFMIAMKWQTITWGYQLLGALFFFVPRAIWATKPIGSGAMLASHQPRAFTNIAMPYWGEGYMNFGILGVVIFTIILAYTTAIIDKKYWKQRHNNIININDGYYLIFLGALLFILRGDLMSSFSYTVGTFASYYVVTKVSSMFKIGKK